MTHENWICAQTIKTTTSLHSTAQERVGGGDFYKHRRYDKKKIIIAIFVVLCLAAGWIAWSVLASTTKIALVNFQPFQTTSFIKSNHYRFIKHEEVSLVELDKLKEYDFVLGFGMGLKATAEQRAQIQSAADKGVPVMIYATTNPDNAICNLDSIQQNAVSNYLKNGNKKNYQSMARYIRQHIDGKKLFVIPADTASESADDVLFHLDENLSFKTVKEYESYHGEAPGEFMSVAQNGKSYLAVARLQFGYTSAPMAVWSLPPISRWPSAATTGPTVWWEPFPISITIRLRMSARP